MEFGSKYPPSQALAHAAVLSTSPLAFGSSMFILSLRVPMPAKDCNLPCTAPSLGRSKNMYMAFKMAREVNKLVPLVISFFVGVVLATSCIFYYTSLGVSSGTQLALSEEAKASAELAHLLRNASMDDNTVIITSINRAYAESGSLLDLFLESFHLGEGTAHLLNHVLVVAMDPGAFRKCKAVHPHCYFLRTPGVDYSEEKYFMTKDYLEMMWRRNRFQQTILELGFNFLFTDIDIMWFRNPLRHIAITSHIAIASDFFFGDPDSLNNLPNGGFLYVKSHNKTMEFYKSWQLARERFHGKNEQYVFNQVKAEFSNRYQVKLQFLDTAYCSGFCQLSNDLSKICTLHANCCMGLANKIFDLRNVLEDWRNYTTMITQGKSKDEFHWRRPGKCIR